jgi:HemY protein
MRFALYLLAVLLLGVLIAAAARFDTGYVLVSYGRWTAEMALTTMAALLLASVALILAAWRALAWLWTLPRRLREADERRRQARARRALARGITDVAEGRFADGERQLVRYAGDSELPIVNYLMAARAAHRAGAGDRRDAYLRAAAALSQTSVLPVLLTQAEMQLDAHQLELALATLRRLQEIKPGHAFGLKLLARAYEQARDWSNLEILLPRLRKSPALAPEEVERFEVLVLEQQLKARTAPGGEAAVKELWTQIPRRLRHTAPLARAYVRALIGSDAHAAAELAIRTALKVMWDEDLVLSYGLVRGRTPAKQLARVEEWLEDRREDAALLLTAGRLCMANQLWGKARTYLQSSLAIAPRVETLEEIGRLMSQLGQHDEAMQAYRDALELSLKGRVSGKKRRRRRKPAAVPISAADEDEGFVRSTN